MKKIKLKWDNLKENRCPQCGKDFTEVAILSHGMVTCRCGFKITDKRMAEIVNDKIDLELKDES